MYLIIKKIKIDGKELPIVLLDSLGEVWEFDTEDAAQRIATAFENNSDSGHTYAPKKIGIK